MNYFFSVVLADSYRELMNYSTIDKFENVILWLLNMWEEPVICQNSYQISGIQ